MNFRNLDLEYFFHTDLEEIFEAVDDLVTAVYVFSAFTQENGLLMKKHLSLHRFKSQVLYFTLVFCRHLKTALHD